MFISIFAATLQLLGIWLLLSFPAWPQQKVFHVCRMNVEDSPHRATPRFLCVWHKREMVHQAF